MDHVCRNRVNNILYRYSIENNKENFQKLAQVINKRDYYIYKQILYMIGNCRIVSEDSSGITVEIDFYEHNTLLEDITKKLFIRKIRTRKAEERACVVSNLFLTFKIWFM